MRPLVGFGLRDETSERGSNRVSSFVFRLRERMEKLQQNLYAIQEAMGEVSNEETAQDARLAEWVGHVEETLDVLVRVPPIEIASRHRPWELCIKNNIRTNGSESDILYSIYTCKLLSYLAFVPCCHAAWTVLHILVYPDPCPPDIIPVHCCSLTRVPRYA